jgi:hypothetical protein
MCTLVGNAQRVQATLHLAIATLFAVACGSDCVIPPCAEPTAIIVRVVSSSGGSVANASVHLTTTSGVAAPCGITCDIQGYGGHYEFDVSAPGFATAHRAIDVSAHVPRCGCVQVDTQDLTVALSPAG